MSETPRSECDRGIKGRVVFAIAAHPDDIEFGMVGTLLRLRELGYSIHYLNVASGSCGSAHLAADEIRKIRRAEAQDAAKLIDATWHEPLVDDLEVFYEDGLIRQLAAIVREVSPSLVLTHSPQDYMEDHTNTSRLAVTATFSRGMANYRTIPERAAVEGSVTLYHAMPHGLCDQLSQAVVPELLVDTSPVIETKVRALECHRSQKDWLDESQGMDSYVGSLLKMSSALGAMSEGFRHAEGWRRHSHFGFCSGNENPLLEQLGPAACYAMPNSETNRSYVA